MGEGTRGGTRRGNDEHGGREIPVAQVSRRDWHGMVGVRQGLDRKWAGRARAASGECRAGPASVGYVTAATTVTACTCHIRRRRPARGSAVGLPMEIADHIIRGNSGICKERNGECGTELSTVELPNWKPCWTGAMRINKSNIKAVFSLPLLSSPPTSSIPSRRRHPLPFRPCGTRGYPLPFQSRLAFVCLTPALVPVPLYLPSSPLFSPTMDMNYDESWCPTCDRQIMPKRFTVAVAVAQPEQPPPPAPPTPDSPSRKHQSILGLPPQLTYPLASKNQQGDITARTSRTRTGTMRPRGAGHGAGRVKLNGALKRSDSTTVANKIRSSSPQSQIQPETKPAAPTKLRTVIDQGPIPLYCSDECRMADLSRFSGTLPINYNPDQASPPLPPVPHNSFEQPICDSEDESSSGSSLDSCLSSSDIITVSPSIATLAAMYDFPPLPSPPPIIPVRSTAAIVPEFRNDYQGGVMMAAKRIQAALCADPATKRPTSRNELPPPQKPIPGWTDGSDAWRESVYSFSPRSDSVATVGMPSKSSFTATSSRGVQWTTSDLATSSSSSSFPAQPRSSEPLPRSSQSYTDELYAKYNLPLTRRSESRSALFPPMAQSTPLSAASTSSRRRREIPLLKAGAEGRLLVPNVTMRAHSASSQSASSASLCSPLSRYPSAISEDNMWNEQHSASASSRPQVQGMLRIPLLASLFICFQSAHGHTITSRRIPS